MSEKELSKFIKENLTFEVLPKSRQVLWYVAEETIATEEEKKMFFADLDRLDKVGQWELVLNIM